MRIYLYGASPVEVFRAKILDADSFDWFDKLTTGKLISINSVQARQVMQITLWHDSI
ncbi:MAG: hypothetical protein ABSB25_08320 [Sedimentisphaerales bacterium]|jgi:hypothetical protein